MARYNKDFRNLAVGNTDVATIQADGWTPIYNSATWATGELEILDTSADPDIPQSTALRATFTGGNESVWFLLDETDATMGEECDLLLLTRASAITPWTWSGAAGLVNANWNGGSENGHAVGIGTNTASLQYYHEVRRQSGSANVVTWYAGTYVSNLAGDMWIWIRVQHEADFATGNVTRRMRAWPYGETEPATWIRENTTLGSTLDWRYSTFPSPVSTGFGFVLETASAGKTADIAGIWGATTLAEAWTTTEADSSVEPPNNNIDDVSIVDGVVSIITRPQDGSALLGTMNFPVLADSAEYHLDLQWTETAAANPITPPYSGLIDWLVAYDGTTAITVTDNGDGTVNIPAGSEGNDIVFGIPYTFSVTPTRVFMRDRDGRVTDMERLSLNYFEVWCQGTELTTSVAPGKGRGPYAGTWDLTDEKYDERVKIPVMADAEDAVITITDTTPWALSISRMGWEGRYFPRTQRAR